MPLLDIDETDGVRLVRMDAPRGNAIGAAMLGELEAELARPSAAPTVLAGASSEVFSSGFDAWEVFAYSRDEMLAFFSRFVRFCQLLTRHPAPVVAALRGHSVAAGALIACAADFRVMAETGAAIRVQALDLGVALPPSLLRMVEDAAGKAGARRLLLAGESLEAPAALECGLAVELAAPDRVLERAVARTRQLAEKPAAAFAACKRALAGPLTDDDLTPFIDLWFGDPALRRRETLLLSLSRK